ncbi:MAG: hypothetical protein ABSA53_05130 [Streptosporangiaceae bacterium]
MSELVDAHVGGDVAGRHHPRQGDPDRRLGDIEQAADPHQGADRKGRRVIAEQRAEDDRPGGERPDGRKVPVLHSRKHMTLPCGLAVS